MRTFVSRLAGVALVLATSAPALAADPVKVSLPVEKYKLENGLEVILHEDHRTPVIAVNVWYHVGSKDEQPGKNGFAHLFEHVMFQGSRHVPEDTFFKFLERAGASERNGTTNTDRTNYFETVPSNQLEVALWLESDRMAFLLDHADEKTFASQREVVKNERRQNYENAPYGLVYPMIRAAMYPKDHPYHLVTIGTPEDLDRASMEDVRGFFKTWYVPNNATLVLAGDLDKAKAKELVQKWFGPIVRGPDASPRTMPMPVALDAEKTLKIEAEVELPRVTFSWPTPPSYSAPDADLDVLAHVLTSGKSSRLYKRLVYELQIAQDVSAYQASAQLSSTFEVQVTLKKGKSIDEVIKIVDEELAKIRATPADAAEIERARAQLLSHLVFDVERVTARANMLNQYNQNTGDPGFIEKDVARYQATSAASVQKTASTFLPEKKRVVAIVVPTPGAPRAGRLVEAK